MLEILTLSESSFVFYAYMPRLSWPICSLAAPVCCTGWLHVRFLEAGRHNLHVLVLVVVNLYTAMQRTITSFDSQTLMYIIVSLIDEYPIPSITFSHHVTFYADFYVIQAVPAQ